VAPAGAGTEARKLRLVTHLDVSREDILRTIDLFWEELRGI
jgi:threonine aldolase